MKNRRTILAKKSGRRRGQVTVRHQGGRQKRYLREIDFARDKIGVCGKVVTFEYDPNRNVKIALIIYEDGEKRYILAPNSLVEGAGVISGEEAPIEIGNALPLSKIPIGAQIHNIEIRRGKGGELVRSAGSFATIQGKEGGYVLVKLPSGEIRKFDTGNFATIGQLGRVDAKAGRIGKAGRTRHMGIRPTVRGVAMHPHAHPHGGGEGRSHVGLKYPKTVYGRRAVGNTRKRKKYSDSLIVQGRRSKASL